MDQALAGACGLQPWQAIFPVPPAVPKVDARQVLTYFGLVRRPLLLAMPPLYLCGSLGSGGLRNVLILCRSPPLAEPVVPGELAS